MKFSNAVVVGVLLAGASGCAFIPSEYLPKGYPSRTNQTPADKLFISTTDSQVSGGTSSTPAAPATGLQIKKSKRGNMESYVVRGQRYYTLDSAEGYSARGMASWYGPNFHGRTASNGEVYDMYRLTAAHKTLPLPTYARVTHVDNGREVIVKINDRGPFSGDRIIDLSFAAALRLGMVNDGTGLVDIQVLSPEEMAVISGPENTLGIEFYYAAGEDETQEMPIAETNTDDIDSNVISVSAVEVDDKPIRPQPISNTVAAVDPDTAAIQSLFTDDEPPAVVKQVAAAESDGGIFAADNIASTNTAVSNIEVVQAAATPQVVPVADNTPALETAVLPGIVDANVQGLATVPAAVQSVQLPSDKDRSGYYIQAGVFADVADAERIAVDAVLAAPGEEVHVKPLKDSHMYRITVGPIVSFEHSTKVSKVLTKAGIENFTVKVK